MTTTRTMTTMTTTAKPCRSSSSSFSGQHGGDVANGKSVRMSRRVIVIDTTNRRSCRGNSERGGIAKDRHGTHSGPQPSNVAKDARTASSVTSGKATVGALLGRLARISAAVGAWYASTATPKKPSTSAAQGSSGRPRFSRKSFLGPVVLVDNAQTPRPRWETRSIVCHTTSKISSCAVSARSSRMRLCDRSRVDSNHAVCMVRSVAANFKTKARWAVMPASNVAAGAATKLASRPVWERGPSTPPASPRAGSLALANAFTTAATPSQCWPINSAAFKASPVTPVGQALKSAGAQELISWSQLSACLRCLPLSFPCRLDSSWFTR